MKQKTAVMAGISAAALAASATLWIFRHEIFDKAKQLTMGTYFTVAELCKSDTAKQYKIDNTPNAEATRNLETLIAKMLNPLREAYGKPIIVSSGYRSAALNAKVGGVANSQHLTGKAADLVPASGGSLKEIFEAAVRVGGYDQLIYEQTSKSRWVHVSYDPSRRRGQMLSYKGGKYTDIAQTWRSVVA